MSNATWYKPLSQADAVQIWTRMQSRIVAGANGCLEWTGAVGSGGYGNTRIGHSNCYTTHRVAWAAANGEIPYGLCVMHVCDNRRCVNPDHLRIGTHSENTRDAYSKGRLSSPMSKRTHCPRGHAYSGVNSNGARICRTCQSAATLRHYHRTKKLRTA